MDLFRNTGSNLLPYDGTVLYHGKVFSTAEADHYFQALLQSIEWRNDDAVIFGKHFVTARKIAWYGDAPFPYSYSGTTKTALPWTNELLDLRGRARDLTGANYNSCLLNLYHSGAECMAWHSDGEKDGYSFVSYGHAANHYLKFLPSGNICVCVALRIRLSRVRE